jgi:hypothetical protein
MSECCNKIPIKNRETLITQWNEDGSSKIVEYYTIYNCEKCGKRVKMNLEEMLKNE